ncbi:hypothetical protein N6H14_33565 [Paenibacillus sp. CC-CFT747]|nr:hypothetical protein N6H14_33565 [Paenibacillus sp. CC-CFT747]
MLDGLDMLVLNDVATDQWKPEQIEAIGSWVKRGGQLVLAGERDIRKPPKPSRRCRRFPTPARLR